MSSHPNLKRFRAGVASLERRFRCRMTVHDDTGDVCAALGRKGMVLEHANPFCEKIKSGFPGFYERCIDCDVGKSRALARKGRPFLKRCHGGVVEWVVPLRSSAGLPHGVLFFGPFRAATSFDWPAPFLRQEPPSVIPDSALLHREVLPVLDKSTLKKLIPQSLLISNRILCLLASQAGTPATPETREDRMRWFFNNHFLQKTSLAALAKQLRLGESRASQLVRARFRATFPKVLNACRLDFAEKLLLHSTMPMHAVAESSGFSNLPLFFRTFKKAHGMTPMMFRLERRLQDGERRSRKPPV